MTFTFEFPVYEVLASVVVTAVVTFLTIRWSISAARRETLRTIRASLEAEARARRDRRSEVEAELRRSEERERTTLVGTLMLAVHELESTGELPRQDSSRLAAEARWGALSAVFDSTPLAGAAVLYAYADLRIDKARNSESKGNEPVSFVQFLLDSRFSADVRVAALGWATSGRVPEHAEKELEQLVAEREQRTRARRKELRRAITEWKESVPAHDADPVVE